MIFDIHVHSDISPCSRFTLSDILKHSRSRGLDGVCITDHETMAAAKHIREGMQSDGLCVIVGMEYATPQGDFLLFGPFETLPSSLEAQELLPLVHLIGGAAVAAHPFRPGRSVHEIIFASSLCPLVEAVNGRNPTSANDKAIDLVRRHDLVGLGGSDAHALAELGSIGTRIHTQVRCREDFIAALRLGRCEHRIMPSVAPPGVASMFFTSPMRAQ